MRDPTRSEFTQSLQTAEKGQMFLRETALVGLPLAHGAHHIVQIQQLVKGDYAAETGTRAAMCTHMFTIVDPLAGALAKQFSEKF